MRGFFSTAYQALRAQFEMIEESVLSVSRRSHGFSRSGTGVLLAALIRKPLGTWVKDVNEMEVPRI